MTTLDFYQNHAQNFFEQTFKVDMQKVYQSFLDNLPNDEQCILDVGCGSGRDSVFFANQSFQVIAIDGSQNLIDLAKQNYLEINWQCLRFEEIKNQHWQNQFTGIWACASLLHIEFEKLPTIVYDLLNCLQSNGVFYASFKYGNGERIENGRFFCDMNEERIKQTLVNLSNELQYETWITDDQRVDRNGKWLNVLVF